MPAHAALSIRPLSPADFDAVLRLNDAEVQHTSPLDRAALAQLVAQAACACVAEVDGAVAGFVLALREGAHYDSANYRWFADRLPRFVYVDRVVVAAHCARRGIGRQLYAQVFDYARAMGVDSVACEYNLQPPNPASRAFHARMGFREAGTQWLQQGAKQVSMQVASAQ